MIFFRATNHTIPSGSNFWVLELAMALLIYELIFYPLRLLASCETSPGEWLRTDTSIGERSETSNSWDAVGGTFAYVL